MIRRSVGWAAAALLVAAGVGAAADGSGKDRGKAAGQSVLDQWGGGSNNFADKVLKPMSTGRSMATVDGSKTFAAQIQCEGSERFLRVTLFPASSNDIQQLALDVDANLDGSTDQSAVLAGPYAGACVNGMMQCDAGTVNNCQALRWVASGNQILLDPKKADGTPLQQKDLGSCYCFNSACGNNLLLVNTKKVLQDIGTGIAVALQETAPRLAIADVKMVDAVTAEVFGTQGGCGAGDKRPEQYFRNSGGLTAAGTATASDPNSSYFKVANSPMASHHGVTSQSCQINRNVQAASSIPPDAISAGAGPTRACGANCTGYLVGVEQARRFRGGDCTIYEDNRSFTVNHPDAIRSATLVEAQYDDWYQLQINGSTVWSNPSTWLGEPFEGASCEASRHTTSTLTVDVTSKFKINGSVALRGRTAVSDRGDGWSWVNVTLGPTCSVGSDTIDNGCAALEAKADCELQTEEVDGVRTVDDFRSTGQSPTASSREFPAEGCSIRVERPYWQKRRTYQCKKAGDSGYDVSASRERWESINGSINTDDGSYSDRRTVDGQTTTSSQRLTMPERAEVAGCVRMCKTRKSAAGQAVTENGSTAQRNSTGVAFDYTYRECGAGDSCPLAEGEEMVSACNCRNNFGEAATMMQAIRQTAQDTLCQAQ